MAKNENTQNADHVWLLKYAKIVFGRGLVGVWKGHWSAFGRLDVSRMRLGHFLGASWSVRARPGAILGPSWSISGGSEKGLQSVGEPWRLPGNILGRFSKDFLPS